MGDISEFGFRHAGGKALHLVITGVHLEQQRGIVVNRVAEVPGVCAVGCPHLNQSAAGACHDIGHAERAAYLYQFAA